MEWHESDPSPSDEEQNGQNRTDSSVASQRKRSSRACDQCRKTKSKCESNGGDGKQCKSCAAAGVSCTFLGPSYKRGPPKGYIHAIEQRWHQVEALIGAILQCPDERVQEFVADLREDHLAREILARVDSGPYGPAGRKSQPPDATKEDFFASILKSNEAAHADASRARRQSRVSREIVSSAQDNGLSVVPTKEWQDNLSKRLAMGPGSSTSRGVVGADKRASQKRRVDSYNKPTPSDWDALIKMESPEDDAEKSNVEGMGLLSLDENSEVRWHGQASGLHLLGRNKRRDDRMDGGIWRLPMSRVWPLSHVQRQSHPLVDMEQEVELPPQAVQDELIELYFAHFHDTFPVLHKSQFLSEYQARRNNESSGSRGSPSLSTSSTFSSPRPEPTQEVTPLLLLSMFALAARFTQNTMPYPQENRMWEAGYEYFDIARALTSKIFHISRPSTVQSLLLMSCREFGIGSMEQAWIFAGSAIRMGFDLGLHCDSSKWKMHGHDMFSEAESQVRRQIWWCSLMLDRYGSTYMGRPIMIKEEDIDTQLPIIDSITDAQLWRPIKTRVHIPFTSVPNRAIGCLVAVSKLAVVAGDIVNKMYPVKQRPIAEKLAALPDLERRLDQWYISLPDELQFNPSSKRYIPPPQIMLVHIRYYGCVILLHRSFIPNWKVGNKEQPNSVGTRALDLSHTAACHIASIAALYQQTLTMEQSSPFLTSFLLSASIVCLLTLTIRPDNLEAKIALEQCMTALKGMKYIWPSAARAWDLLNGVQLRHAHEPPLLASQHRYTDRQKPKRVAQDAFAEEEPGIAEYSRPERTYSGRNGANDVNGNGIQLPIAGLPLQADNGVHDISERLMAHMLGLDAAGVDPFHGSHWYPRLAQASSHTDLPNLPFSQSAEYGGTLQAMNGGMTGHSGQAIRQAAVQPSGWVTQAPQAPTPAAPVDYGYNNMGYGYNYGQYGA